MSELTDTWKDDRLGRRNDADYIISFLKGRIAERGTAGRTRSYVLNLDAGWGSGKTFFLTRLRSQLAETGHVVAYVNAWADDYADDPLLPVMSAIDASIAPLLKSASPAAKAWNAVKTDGLGIALRFGVAAGKSLIKSKLGDSLENLVVGPSVVSADDKGMGAALDAGTDAAVDEMFEKAAAATLADFQKTRQSIDMFKTSLGALLKRLPSDGKELPLFVLIDELDR